MSTNHHNNLSDSANTEPSNSPALSLNTIEQQLNTLIEQDQHRFDPVRFRFIEAMLQRSKKTHSNQPAINDSATQRLANAITEYQQRFQQAQQQAQQHCQIIEQHSTEMASTARQLSDQQQFRALHRLNKQLARRQHQHSPLQQLTDSLLQDHSIETQSQGSYLNQQLSQQEAAASALLNDDVSNASKRSASSELKSIALFRDSWAKRHIDNLTSQAINNRPDNAGPLNPERLASSSLSTIKAISPRYLKRFIGYVDTLLWLQQADQQRTKAVKKDQVAKAKNDKK